MAFTDIQKSVAARFRSLKNEKERSGDIIRLIHGLYPKRKKQPLIREADFQLGTRTLHVYPVSRIVMVRLIKDRELIRAALRAEGFDVRRILIKQL